MHLQPDRGGELVRADDGADLIVQDFCGRAWQAPQAGIPQCCQIPPQGPPQRGSSLGHLQGRECVHMHVRRACFGRLKQPEVGVTCKMKFFSLRHLQSPIRVLMKHNCITVLCTLYQLPLKALIESKQMMLLLSQC